MRTSRQRPFEPLKKNADIPPLKTIRDLLGHRCITSTQIYLHTTAEDLREAAISHPVEHLIQRIEEMLPGERIPFQWPPGEKRVRAG